MRFLSSKVNARGQESACVGLSHRPVVNSKISHRKRNKIWCFDAVLYIKKFTALLHSLRNVLRLTADFRPSCTTLVNLTVCKK